ncbi:MAG: hypothetical protein U0835_04015 [Isosphaeraceae bacterium]
MKRAVAFVITAFLMGGLLWLGGPGRQADSDGRESVSPTPAAASTHPAETCVQSLMESAAKGDVDAYLGAFTGALRERLEREISGRGRQGFADDLNRSARLRKSHAVFSAEPDGEASATVVVESVYADRNERQTYRVERSPGGGWAVADVETVKSRQPQAKFGAPASFEAPEGVPVQGGFDPSAGEDPP